MSSVNLATVRYDVRELEGRQAIRFSTTSAFITGLNRSADGRDGRTLFENGLVSYSELCADELASGCDGRFFRSLFSLDAWGR